MTNNVHDISSTIIIPDIHHKTDVADMILARHPEIERRIFLGDIYDDFGDSPEIAYTTALWHKRMIHDSRNKFLLGNHDVTYMSNGLYTCSGYSFAKQMAINDVMERADWKKSLISIEVHGWLLSHAGYHPEHFKTRPDDRDMYEFRALKMLWYPEHYAPSERHALFEAGYARGGSAPVGGVTWLDWNREFEPIDGVRQIVGHTRGEEPRMKGDNVCIDCGLAWYAIIRAGGELELYEADDEVGRSPHSIEDFGEAHTIQANKGTQ